MNKCHCGKKLKGKQKKYCCRICANTTTNRKHKDYACQQLRGFNRKSKLVSLKGGACEICSYKKSYAALSFHHLDPSKKSFGIDLRQCSNRSWKALETEAAKCQLLCLNCHMEVEHPDSTILKHRNLTHYG